MNGQNQNHQHQHPQKPAPESSKAGGWHVVGRYRTAHGTIGVEIRVDAVTGRLSYSGVWGAGSGISRASMISTLRFMLSNRRGVSDEIPFGGVEVMA